VSPWDTGGALHGDRVSYKILSGCDDYRGRGKAIVLEILENDDKNIAGVFHKKKRNSYVTPLDRHFPEKIRVLSKYQKKAEDAQLVVVQVKRPADMDGMDGRIIEVLGDSGDVKANTDALIWQSGVPTAFPGPVLDEARQTPPVVPAGDALGRKHVEGPVITIDGEDAKDIDDAVTLTYNGLGNYILGVHIADVNHYVGENSELDHEALRRGTSIYLADRVLPMLPRELSNGICSLNEGELRLTLSCIMEISADGAVLSHEVAETALTVDKRMEYPKVTALLKGEDIEGYGEYLPMLRDMERLCGILRDKRVRRGAVSFELEEAKAELDSEGRPVGIALRERGIASDIIEEFMLVCNETVARDYAGRKLPFVFRIHEDPDLNKIRKLKEFAASLGYHMGKKTKHISSGDIQKLMDSAKGKPEEDIINKTALRSLKRARYWDTNEGHYGLAAEYYCHFTSPIRRYPDLQIHRVIKEALRGMSERRAKELASKMRDVCKVSSFAERRAEELERGVLQLMKCVYMKDKVGWEFNGVISGVTGWGIFVELPDTVEGMIRTSDLGEYFEYNEERMALYGDRSGRVYKLGDPIAVIVARVDVEARQIDFAIKPDENAARKTKKKPRKYREYDFE